MLNRAWKLTSSLVVMLLIIRFWFPTLSSNPTYDIGLAFQGGVHAWETGRPEELPTWISTSFLAMLMALVSRVATESQVAVWYSVLNLATFAIAGLVVLRKIRMQSERLANASHLIGLAFVAFAPIVSSMAWKQLNIPALAIATFSFHLMRKEELKLSAFLMSISILLKPLALLLPAILLFRKESRKVALFSAGWGILITMMSQAFLAARAQDLALLNPYPTVKNFSDKARPENTWVCHPENFSPQSLLCRLMGGEYFNVQRLLVFIFVVIVLLLSNQVLQRERHDSWLVFSFACAISPMVSPFAWSHYQLMLIPLMVSLVVSFFIHRAPMIFWAGLSGVYSLTMLVWRPYPTLVGAVRQFFSGQEETTTISFQVMSVSMFAQYLLVFLAMIWVLFVAHARTVKSPFVLDMSSKKRLHQ